MRKLYTQKKYKLYCKVLCFLQRQEERKMKIVV